MLVALLSLCAFAAFQVSHCNEVRKVACEGKSISIQCSGKNVRIDVKYALYGRNGKKTCYKFYHGLWNKNCKSSKSLSEVQKRCQGKTSCTVKAKNSVFGDPCKFTEKYLEVKYVCRVDGGFSKWSKYGECSKSCGGGVMSRSRTCNDPAPKNGGKDCKGAREESKSCNDHPCPVNGGYSKWSAYGECSASCGGGSQSRSRTCDNPAPAHGGKDCKELGAATESRPCNTHPCPVNGGYSKWSEYGECSASCGGGSQSRSRSCDNPAPAHGGKDCKDLGAATESRPCNTHPCPVNGGYSKWSEYGECSASCGGGSQSRSRSCDNPAPAHGGKDCKDLGAATESRPCNAHSCPVNGGYSKWSEYGECSASCGGGSQSRSRSCDNPAPAHGGKDCKDLGAATESRPCNGQPCPVNGGYSIWSEYGECSASCGGGSQSRSRSCDNPAPAHGGKDCKELGAATESRPCNTQACPVPISAEITKTACEGKTNSIQCSGGAVIVITGALYGRKNSGTCSEWYHIHWDKNCKATRSLEIVKEKCEGKASCSVKAENGVFGDPCKFTAKYLTIQYRCRG